MYNQSKQINNKIKIKIGYSTFIIFVLKVIFYILEKISGELS